MRLNVFKCPEPNCFYSSRYRGNLKTQQLNHTCTKNDQRLDLVERESENTEGLEVPELKMVDEISELAEDSQSSVSGVNQVQGNF